MFIIHLRRLIRVFHCCTVCEMMKDYKEIHLIMQTNYEQLCNSLSLGNTFRLVLTSSQLPRQRVSSSKRTSNLQFLQIISETKAVTSGFYCFVGKDPTFFYSSGNMTTYQVDIALFQTRHFLHLQKIPLDYFLPNISI